MTNEWFLKRIGKFPLSAEIEEYVISTEPHKKGGFHVHIYMYFDDKVDIKNASFFDIHHYYTGKPKVPGKINGFFHPHVQKPRFKDRLISYITKEKNYITNIDVRPEWEQIYEDSEDWEMFWTAVLRASNSYKSFIGWKALESKFKIKMERKEGWTQSDERAEKLKKWGDHWTQKKTTDTQELNIQRKKE